MFGRFLIYLILFAVYADFPFAFWCQSQRHFLFEGKLFISSSADL
jgi:hypothetical protein